MSGASSSFADEIITLILIPACIKSLHSKSDIKTWFFFIAYSIFALSAALISKFGGIPQPISAIYDIALDSKFPIIYFGIKHLILKSRNPQKELAFICGFLVIIAIINTPFVILDIFSNGTGIYGQKLTPRLGLYQPQGIFKHHVTSCWGAFFGATCAYYLYAKSNKKEILLAALFLSSITLAHLSTKETVALTLVVSLFFLTRKTSSGLALKILPTAALFILILLFTPAKSLIEQQFVSYFSIESLDSVARTALTVQSFNIANDFFPLGSGAGTYASVPSFSLGYSEIYNKYGISSIWGATPDNPIYLLDVYWPKLLAQGGWIGMLFIVCFFARIFKGSIILFLRNRNNESWLFFSIATSTLIFSTAGAPFSNESTALVVCYFAAYANLVYSRRPI